MSRNSYDMDDSTRNENAGNNSQNRSQNNRHYRQLHSCRKTRYDFLGYRGLGIVGCSQISRQRAFNKINILYYNGIIESIGLSPGLPCFPG